MLNNNIIFFLALLLLMCVLPRPAGRDFLHIYNIYDVSNQQTEKQITQEKQNKLMITKN